MWSKSYSKFYPGLKKETIWRVWKDVNSWIQWHKNLDYCKMEGSFSVGNSFLLKPKEMRPVKIVLTEVEENHKFTDCTHFLGAKMFDTHTLEETANGLILTNTVVVTGLLRSVWVKLVAQDVANSAPEEMEALVTFARGANE